MRTQCMVALQRAAEKGAAAAPEQHVFEIGVHSMRRGKLQASAVDFLIMRLLF